MKEQAEHFTLLCPNNELPTHRRIQEEVTNQGLLFKHYNPYEISLPLDPRSSWGTVLFRSSGVSFNDYDLTVLQAIEKAGVKTYPSFKLASSLRDKLQQARYFEENKIASPPYFAPRGSFSYPHFYQCLEKLNFEPSSGFVFQSIRSNQGLGTLMIQDPKELYQLYQHQYAKGDTYYLIRPLIPSALEYRAYILKGELQLLLKKERPLKGLGNSHALESTPQVVLLSDQEPSFSSALEHIIQKLPLPLYALDLLSYQGKFLLLEVNLFPGVEASESLSDRNLVGEWIKSLS